jgi:glyoxylase-like metal-dependent hydrolase (beta-lactamase superfamily II)
VRAALDPAAQVTNLRQNGTERTVDIRTAQGDVLALTVDGHNRPIAVRTTVYHNVLGDTERVTRFDAYEDLDGVLLPKRFVQRLDRWVEYEIGVMAHTLDADLGALAAPDAVRAAAQALQASQPPGGAPAAAQPIEMQQVSPGIWYGNANLIVEFEDHVTLIELQNEARVNALLATAKALVPAKPVTEAIVSHHHFDHAGGLRTAVAHGLTIIAHRVNEPWFREVVQRPHTIVTDPLARAPRPMRIVAVDDNHTLRDAAMELQLYRVRGSTHGDGILMMYFPRQRVLVESDHWYGPPGQIKPHMRSLYADIRARGLQVDRIAVLHGNGVYTWQEFETSYAEWCCRTTTTTSFVPPTGP